MWRKFRKWAVTAVVAGGAFATVAGTQPPATAKQGRELFEKRCTGCHALDNIKVGPPLRHVYSRPSAKDPVFPYSDALKKADLTWDTATLDRWLADPDAVVPGNDMTFRLDKAEERAAIVAYLRELSAR